MINEEITETFLNRIGDDFNSDGCGNSSFAKMCRDENGGTQNVYLKSITCKP